MWPHLQESENRHDGRRINYGRLPILLPPTTLPTTKLPTTKLPTTKCARQHQQQHKDDPPSTSGTTGITGGISKLGEGVQHGGGGMDLCGPQMQMAKQTKKHLVRRQTRNGLWLWVAQTERQRTSSTNDFRRRNPRRSTATKQTWKWQHGQRQVKQQWQ